MNKGWMLSSLVVVAVLATAAPAQAGLVDVFNVSGTATFVEDLGLWLYEYTVFGDDSPKGLSHWWLELPPFKAESITDPFGPSSGSPWSAEYPSFGEPVAADVITALGTDLSGGHTQLDGIKWDAPDDSDFKDGILGGFSFYSSHGPSDPDAYTWFTKFGKDNYDFGRTLGPNGHTERPIPEPASLLLFGIGLGGLGLRRRLAR